MAKKAAPAKKPEPEGTKQLVDAIITVKHLQAFIQRHGGVDKALEAVACVDQLIALTGSVAQLRQALEIVGREPTEQPAQ